MVGSGQQWVVVVGGGGEFQWAVVVGGDCGWC